MKKKVIIGTIIGLILILSVFIVVFMLLQVKVPPENVLKEYMACIEKKDYEKMYSMTDGSWDKETFITRNKNIYEGIEAYNINIAIAKVSNNNGLTEVVYTTDMYTVAGNLNFVNTAHMIQSNGTYKIVWNTGLIYPDLNEEYKIRVSTISSKRGSILDRNNNVIAEDGIASQVGLVPGKMKEETKEADIKKVADFLGVTVEYVKTNLSASYVKDDTFVPLKTIYRTETELKQKLLDIKGVKIVDSNVRIYPYGEATSHLTGYIQGLTAEELVKMKQEQYTSTSKIGRTGLEKLYEDTLRGIDGNEIYITDGNNVKIKTIASKSVKNGENIKITVDANLQKNIYDVYQNDKSATVVINPKTGEILAAVSTPTFNSNDFSLGMTDEKWNSLSQDENKPMYNRFLASYTPGSSFKPVTGAIGLTTNTFTAVDDFGKSSLKWQLDSSWGDYYITTLSTYNGVANIRNALIYSDNIYFAKAALKVGKTKFVESLKNMGFNAEMDTELGKVSSTYSTSGDIVSEMDLANTGFGQGELLVNPLHMAMVYSAFANDGNMINPYLIYKDNPTGTFYKTDVISQESANVIKDGMIQVVENPSGTGHGAKTEGLSIAGKTGTAEVKASKDDKEGTEIGWFNCFTTDKSSNKQFLIISMVEDVKNRNGSHYVVNRVKRLLNEM